jgi:hypothetical protein
MAGEESRTDETTVDPNEPLINRNGEEVIGIRCPHCNCPHHSVEETRMSTVKFHGIKREYIRRRRLCRYCGLIFNTREVVEPEVPDRIKHPSDLDRTRKIIKDTIENVIPRLPSDDLINPFLPEG